MEARRGKENGWTAQLLSPPGIRLEGKSRKPVKAVLWSTGSNWKMLGTTQNALE